MSKTESESSSDSGSDSGIKVIYICIYCDFETDTYEMDDFHMKIKHPEEYQIMLDCKNARTPQEKAEARARALEARARSGRFNLRK